MKKTNKIDFNLGQPFSGWIPVYFKSGNFILEFTSSKTPENPTDKLCEALILICGGVESEMCWTEEPVCYYLKFKPTDNIYSLKIDKTDRKGHNRTEIFYENGGFEKLILPIYRGLKKWNTINHESSDWKKTEQTKLDKLTGLIKKKKN